MADAQQSIYQAELAKLADVLQSWPLYRPHHYKSALMHTSDERGVYTPDKFFLLPNTLQLFCPVCQQTLNWTCDDPKVYAGRDFHSARYRCRNCGRSAVDYFFYWKEQETATEGLFVKVGQYPPLESEPAPELRLGREDFALYRKALTSRNFSFGIGALAYLRRVVENRMNALLDLVVDAAKSSGSSPEEFHDLNQLRVNGTFEEKARFAASKLPNHLKPHGHNPLNVISRFASEGLHAGSEEECLQTFDEVRFVFEYLFRHLTFESEDAKSYQETLTGLSSRTRVK